MTRLLHQLIFGVFLILTFLSVAAPVRAQAPKEWEDACVREVTNSDGSTDKVATIQGIQCLIANVFSVAITILGLVGFVMLVIGSFYYLLSGGNSKGVETAQKTFTYAIIGLVVALSSFIILRFLAQFTGVSLIERFTIPTDVNQLGP